MAFHLTVFGQHAPPEEQDEEAIRRITDRPPHFMLRRCPSPAALYEVVRGAVQELNAPVRLLDLYDHGGNGHLVMGDPLDELLFNPFTVGHALAGRLAGLLTFDAHVRLIGCETALGQMGKDMLLNLQRAFGKGIVVSGTLAPITPDDFGARGFHVEREEALLFSSTEAAALHPGKKAPTYDERYAERIAWRKGVG